MVPSGWKKGLVSDLADTVMGYAFKSNDFVKEGIPLVRMGNLYQNQFQLDRSPIYLPDDFATEYKRFLLQSGDLVMSMTGTMGKRDYGFAVEIPENTQDCLLNQRVLKIEPRNSDAKGFVLNVLKSEIFLSKLYSLPGGTKQANLSATQIREISVLIPPLSEQQKIANILSTWDKAISTTERLIDNSTQQKKALMQQLLTGKKRLLNDNGERFSGEWEEVKLAEIGKCINGLTYSPSDVVENNGMLVLRSSNVQDGKLAFDDNVYVNPDLKVKSKTREGDILICVRNGSKNLIGKSALVKGKAVNEAHGAFMTLYRSIYPTYVFQVFQSNLFYRQVNKNLGATINSINTSDLHKFKFLMPSNKNEIKKIAAVLTSADNEIERLEQQLAHLQQEKKALMQVLLTGKKRVVVDG